MPHEVMVLHVVLVPHVILVPHGRSASRGTSYGPGASRGPGARFTHHVVPRLTSSPATWQLSFFLIKPDSNIIFFSLSFKNKNAWQAIPYRLTIFLFVFIQHL